VPRRVWIPLVAAAGALACSGRGPTKADWPDGGEPFVASAPQVYVAKVKNLLVGLAPTAEEVKAVEADPRRFGALVDGWMARPEYGEKLRRFFELAFQQTQLNANDFADQVFAQIGRNDSTTPLMLQNVEESFARTMVELTAQDHPFTEAMTTRQVMMTTAVKELYALLDAIQVSNEGNFSDTFRSNHRDTAIIVGAKQGPIPLAETLDPTSPNYMHWFNPDVATEETIPECQQDPVSLPPTALGLHFLLLGSVEGRRLTNGTFCPGFYGTVRGPQFTPADFADWTMVTVRTPGPGEPTSTFYDLPALRQAKELVLQQPRLGFFSTPAFFANWQTNTSNQMRVTVNQTLIVATGAAIDGGDDTTAPGSPGLDSVHSKGACLGCHLVLDPTRSIFSATWSWNYHTQQDDTWAAETGMFAFRGVVRPVTSIDDFAQVLVGHPLLAPAWVQKLCFYLNSAGCDEQDPEFQRLTTQFRAGFSWRKLVKGLVISPLVTHAADTRTARVNGEVVAVSRRDHLCAALGKRLGLVDPCALETGGGAVLGQAATASLIPKVASGLPSDGYGRGAVAPILPNDPSLFFAAGLENICKEVAQTVVDGPPGAGRRWSSAQPDAAIADFVGVVMALADGRSAKASQLLRAHFDAAMKQPGTTATQALRSTFVVACQAPSAISVGL
jgi:hypothetical protein